MFCVTGQCKSSRFCSFPSQ